MVKQRGSKLKSSKKGLRFFNSLTFKIFLGSAVFFVVFFVSMIFIPISENLDCFKTIDDALAYAQSMPELPKPDNKNLIKPNYTSFYRSNLPGIGSKIKTFLRLGKRRFTASFFKDILKAVTAMREQLKFKGNFIHKLSVNPGQNFIVFGDLQGAYHSLTRDLVKLRELKLINNDFTLANPQDYMVFMGDCISRSPYTMEALALILRLMQANGKKVIALKGNHESGNYWQQHSLKLELDIRAEHLGNGKILAEEVNQFFDTLPLALYLEQKEQLVRISPWSADDEKHELVKENLYADFLVKPAKGLQTFMINKDDVSSAEVPLRVVIKAQKKREKFQLMDGLRFLPPERGATAWTLLACPTLPYQKLFRYFHDSFSVLKIGTAVDNWIITKYSRHVEKNENFYSVNYNFVSGKQLGEEEIVVQVLEKVEPEKAKAEPVEKKEIEARPAKILTQPVEEFVPTDFPEGQPVLQEEEELEEGEVAWGVEEQVKPVARKKARVKEKSDIESEKVEKPKEEKMEEEEMGFEPDVQDFVEE